MRYAARHGFTLVELLVVVAIIAVMLSTAALSVGSGTASVRMKNAVRSVWQLSGYARTMALLNQTPVDLVVDLRGGRFSLASPTSRFRVQTGGSTFSTPTASWIRGRRPPTTGS